MPYIDKEDREQYEKLINKLFRRFSRSGYNPGHMNYIISMLLKKWWQKASSYATINAIMGVLACTTQEFYRKRAVQYEELKERDNGPI